MITLSRSDKLPLLTLLRQALLNYLIPYINMQNREAVIQHFAWLERQREEMDVECTFETIPEERKTRIVIEIGFGMAPRGRFPQ